MRAVFRDNRIFIYDAFIQKESIKEIPGRLWHPEEKAWSIPAGAYNIETLDLLGCELSSELRKMKKEYVCEGLEEPQTFISAPLKVSPYEHQLIPIESIPDLNTEITQLYLDKVLSDIIKDILELCGGGYNLDVTPRGVRIYKYGEFYAYPEFRITPNTHLIFSPLLRGGVSHSTSIDEMKNSIKVVSEKDNVYSLLATKKDESNISKYGLIQKVVKIDPEKENANTVANTQLAELNQKKESFSCEIIEALNSYTRAGMIITIEDKNYLIEGSGHSIKNGIHYVKLDLRRWSA